MDQLRSSSISSRNRASMAANPTIAEPTASASRPKKNVACSRSTPTEFFLIFLLGCSRKILGVRTEYKMAMYLIIVFLGSLFAELFTLPKDGNLLLRVSKPMNTFVIRFGFGWILVVNIPFMVMTCRVFSRNTNWSTFANLCRMIVNSGIWFVMTSIFLWYYASKGFCHIVEQSNATHTAMKNLAFRDCRRQGYQWTGFDVSGHTFLLIFCNLVVMEECSVMKLVDRVIQLSAQWEQGSVISKRDHIILKVLIFFSAVTVISYDWTLLMTSLYYHTILEKMLAFLFAAGAWYVCYRVVFPKLDIHPGAGSSPY